MAILVALIAAASAGAVIAPELPVRQLRQQNWFLEEGLPQAAATAVVQDADGFLWVGTQDGLARFDGRGFEVFRTADTPGLAGNAITHLRRDHHDWIWIATKTGVSVARHGLIERIDALEGVRTGIVNGLAEDGSRMWVATEAGLRYSDGQNLRVAEHLVDDPVYGVDLVESMVAAGVAGGLWLGDQWLPTPNPAAAVKQVLADCGGVWVASSHGLLRLADGLRRVAALPEANINVLHCDDAGVLWVGEGKGLWRLKDGQVVDQIRDEAVLRHLWIMSIAPEREGGLWLGTISGGLYRLSEPGYLRFNQLEGLPFSTVWALAPAVDGGVWVAGASSIVRIVDDMVGPELAPPELRDSVIMTVHDDTETGLWVGTRNGLYLRTRDDGWTQILDQGTASVQRGPDGRLLAGSLGGLWELKSGKPAPVAATGAEVTRVRTMATIDERLLIGSSVGAYALTDGEIQAIGPPAFESTPIAAIGIDDEVLALGSLGSGLAVLRDGTWRTLGRAQGLLADTYYYLDLSEAGWLWASTNRGVFRVRTAELFGPTTRSIPIEPIITVTGAEPGATQGYCCNGGTSASGVRDERGRLWLPSLDGVVRIDTQRAGAAEAPPEVVLRPSAVGAYAADGMLQLPVGQRDIRFRFTAPTFVQPGSVAYRFRLVGYETAWRSSSFGETNYTNLPHGDYVFEVALDRPQAPVTRQSVSVPRLPREHPLVAVAAAALLVGLGWLFYRWRLAQLRHRELQLEEQVASRTADLESANRRLKELAELDPLTGVGNRNYLHRRIERDVQAMRARSEPSQHLAFLLIDIDHFKAINDRYGHGAGDAALQAVAARLREVMREHGYLVRWGGEEFLWVIPDCDEGCAEQRARALTAAIATRPFAIPEARLTMTCSVGFAVLSSTMPRSEQWGWPAFVELADAALYESKRAGRDAVTGLVPVTDATPPAVLLSQRESRDGQGLRLIGPFHTGASRIT